LQAPRYCDRSSDDPGLAARPYRSSSVASKTRAEASTASALLTRLASALDQVQTSLSVSS
jgi:hypothetical protein